MRVAAVVPYEGGIVLVRHVKDGRSYHLLPGGGVEPGESLASALIRELREETGLVCEVDEPLFISDSIAPDGSRHVVQLTFRAHVTSGELTRHPEDARVAGVEVYAPGALTDLDLRPPMAEALQQAAAVDWNIPARYLGPLWSDLITGITGTVGAPATDG